MTAPANAVFPMLHAGDAAPDFTAPTATFPALAHPIDLSMTFAPPNDASAPTDIRRSPCLQRVA